MAKDARLELRVELGLKARVDARAAELGQKTTTFVERALEKALSETEGPGSWEQAAPGPVGSSEPVRAAASPRASRPKKEKVPSSPSVEVELPKIARRHWT